MERIILLVKPDGVAQHTAEILVFDISVTPSGETQPFNVKLKREFVSN